MEKDVTQASYNIPIDPVELQIGHMIRMIRLIRGMSQQDLARKLGVSFQQVQKYEKATTRIPSSRLYEIARIVDMPVQVFFNGLNSTDTHPTVIGGTIDLYKDLSPQFGLHEFMELNRAVIGISNREIRNAVLKLVDEAASAFGDASADNGKAPKRFRPSFRPHQAAAARLNLRISRARARRSYRD